MSKLVFVFVFVFGVGLALSSCVINEDKDGSSSTDTGTSQTDTSANGEDTSSGGDTSPSGDSSESGGDTSTGGGDTSTGGGDTSTGGGDTSSSGDTSSGGGDTGEVVASETDCEDGTDNDEDGLTDCEDDDCAEDAACLESDCGDGVDDDGDGDVDCDDADCEGSADCIQCHDTDLGTSVGDAVATGNNAGEGDDTTGSCIYGTGGEDVAFLWESPDDNCYIVDVEDSDYDTALYIWSDCSATEVDCDDDGGAETTSLIEFCASAGDTFVFIVDAYSSTSSGYYSLDVNLAPESTCDDGLDNDGDGDVDCDDSDCTTDTACYEAVCDDKLDDEGDGDVDCDDSDCDLNLSCADPTLCPAVSLGAVTGDRVAHGTNTGWQDDELGSCGSTGGEDVMIEWEAPTTDCYTFDTEDSDYDTVLRQYDACGGGEIICDDDGGDGTTSLLELDVIAGLSYLVSIDAYSSSSVGSFVLDITEGCAKMTP